MISVFINIENYNQSSFNNTINSLNKNNIGKSNIILFYFKNNNDLININDLEDYTIIRDSEENFCREIKKYFSNDDRHFISFLNCGDIVSSKFSNILSRHVNQRLICFPIIDLNKVNKDYFMNDLTIYKSLNCSKVSGEINLIDEPYNIWTQLSSAIIRADLLNEIFEKFEISDYKTILFFSLFLNKSFYKVDSNYFKLYEKTEHCYSKTYIRSLDDEFYRAFFNGWFSLFKQIGRVSKIPEFIQVIFCYQIHFYIKFNHTILYADSKFDDDFKNSFIKQTKILFNYIDNSILFRRNRLFVLNKQLILYFAFNKYNDRKIDIKAIDNDNNDNFNVQAYVNDDEEIYNMINNIGFNIEMMEINNGFLYIDANVSYNVLLDNQEIYINVVNRDNKTSTMIKGIKNERLNVSKLFGKNILRRYCYSFKIPLGDNLNDNLQIYPMVVLPEGNIKLILNFSKYLSKLSNSINNYWVHGERLVFAKDNNIIITRATKFRVFSKVMGYLKYLLISRPSKRHLKVAVFLFIYLLTKRLFSKRKIWIFYDKLYKGGDNAEYLYKYALKQDDDIDKYYFLDKSAVDIKRFEKENLNYVTYKTLKSRLLFLNADVVFATHAKLYIYGGFNKIEKYFRGYFNFDSVCIQHGLTTQNLSVSMNRIADGFKMYFITSEFERKNLLLPSYDYKEKNIVKTGLPRYDGLRSKKEKMILISPTWRNDLASKPKIGKQRDANESFKDTEYFKIYNGLINNEKLLKYASEHNYKIIYLVHPVIASQKDDFDANDYVEVLASTDDVSYEDLLTRAAVLVTDYSGIQFDFAYMYKPVVYFHPDSLPPHYEESIYKYEEHGLGEIVTNTNDLVDLLCENIKNECKINDKYRKRIDEFFYYHDYNNCERIYNEVIKNIKE